MRNIIDSYNDFELKQLIEKSTSFKDLARHMGYTHGASGDTIKKLRKRVERFDTSHFKTSSGGGNFEQLKDEDIFKKDSAFANKTVRKHYKNGNYSEYKCSICGQLPFWNGQELTLILDHKMVIIVTTDCKIFVGYAQIAINNYQRQVVEIPIEKYIRKYGFAKIVERKFSKVVKDAKSVKQKEEL